mgnify:CR=1 FL=1
MFAWLAALSLATAMTLALWSPRRSRPGGAAPGAARGRDATRQPTPHGSTSDRLTRALSRFRLPGRRPRARDTALAALCIEVASRLRAGASVDEAWNRALSRGEPTATPSSSDQVTAWRIPDGGNDVPERLLALAGQSPAADAAITACRMAQVAGTPLADVLQTCAAGIAEAEAAHADRRRALAGPASTAKLLGWLPVASLLLGSSLGSDPIGVALEGGLGLLSLVLGLGLLLAGRAWTRALVRVAEHTGAGG